MCKRFCLFVRNMILIYITPLKLIYALFHGRTTDIAFVWFLAS